MVMNSVMTVLILRHGVDAFMHLILIRKALGLIFGILIFVGYLFTSNKMNDYTQKHNIDWQIKVPTHSNEGLAEEQ